MFESGSYPTVTVLETECTRSGRSNQHSGVDEILYPSRDNDRLSKRIDDRTTPSKKSSVIEDGQLMHISKSGYTPTNLFSEFYTPERKGSSLSTRKCRLGDDLVENPSDTTRVYAMNVNVLFLDHRGGQFDEVCKVAKEDQADFLCCQETNVDASQSLVRNILYHATRQHRQRSRMVTRSTPTTFASMYKPGGTLVLSTGNVSGRLTTFEADCWGLLQNSRCPSTQVQGPARCLHP
jgi:hypothetical protein